MNNGNFIKLNRSILKWEWYDDINTKAVFLHALLKANYEEGAYRGHKLMPGDVVFGRKKWAEQLGLSERQVRTAIEHLKETGEISTIKTTNRFTVLRIENWALYQSKDGETTNKRPTSDQQATNKRPRTKKEKKGRREEERERTARKSAYGRKGKVMLTDEEYKAIKEHFTDADGLINHVGEYLANASKHYEDHDSLIWQIGKQDKWAVNHKTQTYELSQEEIDRMRTEAFGEGWKQ